MHRLGFIRLVLASGFRWAWHVLHHVHTLLGIIALVGGIAFTGVLLNRPAWFLGALAVLLLILVLGEGAYRVWKDADTRAGGAAAEQDGQLSLVDHLHLALKRGERFQQQIDKTFVPDPALLTLARGWHDGIYKALIAAGRREDAKAWLTQTEAIPEIATIDMSGGGLNPATPVIRKQVASLKGLVERLENGQC